MVSVGGEAGTISCLIRRCPEMEERIAHLNGVEQSEARMTSNNSRTGEGEAEKVWLALKETQEA